MRWFAIVTFVIYSTIATRLLFIFSHFSTENQHVIEPPIIFGAFNIQNFGVAKMSNERAVKTIVRIIRHFDIIVLQEIVDKSEKAINKLLGDVNNGLHSSARYINILWSCFLTISCWRIILFVSNINYNWRLFFTSVTNLSCPQELAALLQKNNMPYSTNKVVARYY